MTLLESVGESKPMSKRRASKLAIMLLVMLASLLLAARTYATDSVDSLAAAINAANQTGSGTITLTGDITLAGELPSITGNLAIDGDGHSISGNDEHRIFDIDGGQLTLKQITLTRGRAETGGAISLMGGSARLQLDSSSLIANSASEHGGALFVAGGSVSITRSSFVKNHASIGGGAVYLRGANLQATNSTFSENTAGAGGGAFDLLSGSVELTHLTLARNRFSHANSDSAILNVNATVALRNSLVIGSGSGDHCSGALAQNIGNLSQFGSCNLRAVGEPRLSRSAGDRFYYQLSDGSPALDAADPKFCLPTDQLGTPRPHGAGCDVGAIESTTAKPAPTPIVPPPPCPLPDRIIAANTNAPSGGCPAGSGRDTITLDRDIVLSARLPAITSEIVIEGNGHTISGAERFRIFDIHGGTLWLNNLRLEDGVATDGGAILIRGTGKAIISNSAFVNNTAEAGGAIHSIYPSRGLSIAGSSFIGNHAEYDGGAINVCTTPTSISGSSFIRNTAGSDGGAISKGCIGAIEIINSTFLDNKARRGGTLSTSGEMTTMTHVTAINGGLWIHAQNHKLRLRNSIISGGKGDDCHGRLAQNINNFIADGSCSPMLSGDPMLEPATNESAYRAPLPGSPLIRASHPGFCPKSDQLGNPRAQVGGCDIGAIESLQVMTELSTCLVTTTHGLNFRQTPGGDRIGIVPEGASLPASARTPGWFKVEYAGATGWISADYVITEGACD